MRTTLTLIAVLLCALSPLTALAGNAPVSDAAGDYRFTYLGNEIEVKVEQDGAKIRAVATVEDWFGQLKTYHFSGAIENGLIRAHNPGGHQFLGRCPAAGRLVGVIKTKSGLTVPFNVARR